MDGSAGRIGQGETEAAGGTRLRVLDTAEQLFAREGPAAVTLRSIAAAARVNVAAVNYHFGSKDRLFEEMFLRRIAPLNEERLAGLARASEAAGGRPGLEAIVTAYVMPAMRLIGEAGGSARAIIVQYSLGRVLAMPQVDTMLVRYYDQVRKQFVAALQQAAPHLAPHEVVWRYYWMGGSLMVSLAVPPGMVGPKARPGAVAPELIAFMVQGFAARDTQPAPAGRQVNAKPL